MTKEEYLRLIQRAYASDNEDDLSDIDIDCNAWIPSEPLVKKKPISNMVSSIDATNLKRSAIEKIVLQTKQINVDKFMVLVKKSETDAAGIRLFDVVVYETRYKTATGLPCNMQIKVNLSKDNRFNDFAGSKLFSHFGGRINEKTFVELIKWLQAVTKLTAFL